MWLETGLVTLELCRFAGAVFGVKQCGWSALSEIDGRASYKRLGLAHAACFVEKLCLRTFSGNIERADALAFRGMQHMWLKTHHSTLKSRFASAVVCVKDCR